MDQKIRVRIAEHEYPMSAPTPELEKLIRLAAEEVNRKLSTYKTEHPGRSETDLLAFVALNKTIAAIATKMQLDAVNSEIESLGKDLGNYLDNIGK